MFQGQPWRRHARVCCVCLVVIEMAQLCLELLSGLEGFGDAVLDFLFKCSPGSELEPSSEGGLLAAFLSAHPQNL